ncbi:AraC family transcriptional regulator [Izhakiella australiensis]|uniref:AraC family transcriptional regulator n=1 Tax=Izhakiella australiensis TaxID=1926881 RepID=A0A1S8YM29_9GAMM|nr:helix-turn-helix domain-containing protein [Izhakiella australiensis]OON40149.1 AraC family transcriptional regulator [Izhakiella australiensis]
MATPVWFLMLPGVLTLDVTGPAETLALSGDAFALRYIGPVPVVKGTAGLTFGEIEPLPEQLPPGSILVVPGAGDSRRSFSSEEARIARNWLARQQPAIHAGDITIICICSGTLLAAQAGILNGVECTTHHNVISRLRQAAPAAKVRDNRIFVVDQGVWSSAGITTGIDLALHLIHQRCGAQTALEVAREMVVWFRRAGDDPQLSPWLQHRNHQHPAIHRAQDLMLSHPQDSWPLEALAGRVHVSARHLSRLFRQHLGISVHDYHQSLRLAIAQQQLVQGESLERAALAAGFSSARQLRRMQTRQPAI